MRKLMIALASGAAALSSAQTDWYGPYGDGLRSSLPVTNIAYSHTNTTSSPYESFVTAVGVLLHEKIAGWETGTWLDDDFAWPDWLQPLRDKTRTQVIDGGAGSPYLLLYGQTFTLYYGLSKETGWQAWVDNYTGFEARRDHDYEVISSSWYNMTN